MPFPPLEPLSCGLWAKGSSVPLTQYIASFISQLANGSTRVAISTHKSTVFCFSPHISPQHRILCRAYTQKILKIPNETEMSFSFVAICQRAKQKGSLGLSAL